MTEYRIRRMAEEDAARAAALERICFTDPWSEAAYNATLLLPYAHYYVAEQREPTEPDENGPAAGKLIGVIGLELISGEGEISNVAVLPQFRRQGIAHALMETVLTDGRASGCTAFTLEVREGNTAARALYESFGFVTEGVRRHYYDSPTEDALILWRREPAEQKGNQ